MAVLTYEQGTGGRAWQAWALWGKEGLTQPPTCTPGPGWGWFRRASPEPCVSLQCWQVPLRPWPVSPPWKRTYGHRPSAAALNSVSLKTLFILVNWLKTHCWQVNDLKSQRNCFSLSLWVWTTCSFSTAVAGMFDSAPHSRCPEDWALSPECPGIPSRGPTGRVRPGPGSASASQGPQLWEDPRRKSRKDISAVLCTRLVPITRARGSAITYSRCCC